MTDISADDIEIRAMQRAYDELKALDPEGVNRALHWLIDKFACEHATAKKARESSARKRVTRSADGPRNG